MKKMKNNQLSFLLIFVAIFISINLKAQTLIDTSFLFVYAKPGLNLRSEPNQSSEILVLAKYGDAVKPKRQIDTLYRRIENRRGKWLEVSCQGQTGYMFSGFLSRLPRPNIIQSIPQEDFLFSQIDQYFINRLYQVSAKDTIVINGCNADPDCKEGADQIRYQLNNSFKAIEHYSYESYTKEIVGTNWAFEDVIDIVETLISFKFKMNAFTIKKTEGQISYTYQGETLSTNIFIKKVDGFTTSISYGSYP